MQIVKVSLDGSTHSAPVDVSGTDQEMADATIAASKEDKGCHAILGEFISPFDTPTVYHLFASSGVLVISNLGRVQSGSSAARQKK